LLTDIAGNPVSPRIPSALISPASERQARTNSGRCWIVPELGCTTLLTQAAQVQFAASSKPPCFDVSPPCEGAMVRCYDFTFGAQEGLAVCNLSSASDGAFFSSSRFGTSLN